MRGATEMLNIDNLHAYYGKSHVLHGVSFNVQPGEIVALLGRNGSGRSTTANDGAKKEGRTAHECEQQIAA